MHTKRTLICSISGIQIRIQHEFGRYLVPEVMKKAFGKELEQQLGAPA